MRLPWESNAFALGDHTAPGLKNRGFDSTSRGIDVTRQSVQGGLVLVIGQAARLILQLGSTAVLARFLLPADFGLVAMVTVFTGTIGLFQDFGLSTATIQRAQIQHHQVSALFWITIALSLTLASIIAAMAPAVSWFYGKPELTPVTVAIGSSLIFSGISAQHIALMRRRMRFNQLALIDVCSIAFGATVAIALAFAGWGYWALVLMQITMSFTKATLSFCLSGWIPGRPIFDKNVKSMLRFGTNMTAFTIVNYVTRNADNLLVGRFVGASALGLYSKAYGLLLLPVQQITRPLSAVVLPALSRLQDDPVRYRNYYFGAARTIAYCAMPLVVMLGVLSEDVILILLGPEWMGAVTIFRIFAIYGFWHSVSVTTGWVLVSRGHANRMFKWGLFQSIVAVVAYAAGLPWGAEGVAVAVTIQASILVIPQMMFAYRDSPIEVGALMKTLLRPALFSAMLFASMFPVDLALSSASPFLRIAAVLGVVGVTSLALFYLCPAFWNDLHAVLRQFKRSTPEGNPPGRAFDCVKSQG